MKTEVKSKKKSTKKEEISPKNPIKLPSSMQPGEEGFFVIYHMGINIPCRVTRVAFLTHKILYDVAVLVSVEGKDPYVIYLDNVDSVFIQKEKVIEK